VSSTFKAFKIRAKILAIAGHKGLRNFCSSLGEVETNKQIDAAFSVWESVCSLKFK